MKHGLIAAILFFVGGSAFAQERELKQFVTSGSWAEGLEFCDSQVPVKLAQRPDARAISPELLTRLALYCTALASGADRDEDASWWWYTATNLHTDTSKIAAEVQKLGVPIHVPPPRKFGGKLPEDRDPHRIRLPSGDYVAGQPARPSRREEPPKYMFRHTPGVWATEIEVELFIGRNGVPRQPLLVTARAWPLHVFYVYSYLRSWSFEPALVDDQPVDSLLRINVSTRSGNG